jgi:hypothetical protein
MAKIDPSKAKPAKQNVRLPQRSEPVAGNEAEGLKPIAAAQPKNPTTQPSQKSQSPINRH